MIHQVARLPIGIVMALAGCSVAFAGSASSQAPVAVETTTSHAPNYAGDTHNTDYQRVLDPSGNTRSGISSNRAETISTTAHDTGFRAGLAHRAMYLRSRLQLNEHNLDHVYDFGVLLQPGDVLPPVIQQAKDLTHFEANQMRTSTQVYSILSPERFVSVPPTWRDYLLLGLPSTAYETMPDPGLLPKTSAEKTLWRANVNKGWSEGERDADRILDANFHRITRDYTGMLTYATLLQRGMITSTSVAQSSREVTGDSQEMHVNDTTRRITGRAVLVPNPRAWRVRYSTRTTPVPFVSPASDAPRNKP